MVQHTPRVSIGMPVYNGDHFIEAALDSLLAQTFTDFELIISDNASTDQTQAICQAYAARDDRIRYYRNDINLGAAGNFNRTVELARGEYFKWAAHDDVQTPDFLGRAVAVLDSDPGVVLVYARARIIDEDGDPVQDYDVDFRTDSPDPKVRFHDLLWITHRVYQVFGLMRTDVLRKTKLIEPYSASDRVLVIGMSLFGRFHEIPEYLFFPRKHAHVSVRSHVTRHTRMVWFDPSKKGKILLPAWALWFGYRGAIKRASLKWGERRYCYRQMWRWAWDRRKTLREDVVIAFKQWWLMRFRPNGRLKKPVRSSLK
ncbi:MAG: glycosyltransferase [Chloroflexi bacterium]|nr:glycosyltransferase [Chloroflexota bacterium]